MIGQTLGNYRVIQLLGDGGMGSVYRAVDEMLDREVAIKVLRPELTRQESLDERFRQEARALARLSHPGIATLHGMERHGEELLMIMEYVRGDTLEKLVERSGRLSWSRAAELCIAILNALDHAHDRQIVHRDIKPANVMLSSNGTVKVMDFGIARMLGKNRQTQFGHAVGTPTYMAPEQLRGEEVDRRTDLYAVGAVLYELVTGRMAFEADSDYQLMMLQLNEPPPPASASVPDVPGEIDRIIWRAMAKQREDRFADATAFTAALQASLSSLSAAAPARETPATRLGVSAPPLANTAATPLAGAAAVETRLAGGVAETRMAGAAGGMAETPLAGSPADAGVAWPQAAGAHHAGTPAHTRMAAATRWVAEALPDWKRDWRTWLALGALFVTVGLIAMALRGPGEVPDTPGRMVANGGAPEGPQPEVQPTLASADGDPVDPGPSSGESIILESPRESASDLIINQPTGPRGVSVGPGQKEATAPPPPPPVNRNQTSPRTTPTPESPRQEPERREVSPPPQPPPDRREETPARPAGQTEAQARAAISAALGGVASELSGRSTGTAQSILSADVRDQWVSLMREGRISMGIDGTPDIQLSGDNGSASFAATVNVRSPFGANRRQNTRFSAQLVRRGESWVVTSVRPVGGLNLR